MTAFMWDPALETGQETIDEQHRGLFELAARLDAAAARAGVDDSAVADAIYSLTDYVLEHFSSEEAYMAERSYPGLGSHKGLHERLTAETMRLTAAYFNGDASVAEKIGPFIVSWLKDHIRAEDMAFAEFARQ
jgi:hemerythrin-like metal-binding protein